MANPALVALYTKCIAHEKAPDKETVEKQAQEYMTDTSKLVQIEPKKCIEVVSATTSPHVAKYATWLRTTCDLGTPLYPIGWNNAIILGMQDYLNRMEDGRYATQFNCIRGRLLVNLVNSGDWKQH